ncbi:conserved hypothetical protein [Lodderomyces elongisporus NRRL YB-4239]|uniref:Reverse transcriptase Ty1/copia-type domain-containing protein n=1 Tax=Lodderomyces elongisporus (strain ATCC 11503 / CBS 2605 / JCM 1781 / NBRC 1676 / NRRL YB-4239) TaxID=379508 RepID=A5DXY5_LODEL|nr:conserved hypothetical protein [Lodderomyces elongisporus NRRL YB-4239]
MQSPLAHKWKEACDAEINAHLENNTYVLVDLPKGRKAISNRWVLSIKDDGRIKGRVVIRGFSQIHGIDYEATFAPVIRYESMRIMLAIAAQYKMQVHQMDVTTAFLNAELDEEIYMKQIEGYEDPKHKDKVLKLNKSLYGLKQAPLAWNQKINEVLIGLGFKRNSVEYCLYSRKSSVSFSIVALYVDDLLIAATTDDALKSIKEELMKAFKMKDLGRVDKFLGLNIHQTKEHTIKITLQDYIDKMLKEFGMEDCKAEITPTVTSQDLSNINDTQKRFEDGTQYRSLVGKLLFAANTVRYDISYIVGVLSRYLQEPKEMHWNAAKRVLRYLKGTKDFGLNYKSLIDHNIYGYTDADYANDKMTRRSVTGFIFKYAGCIITWRSKKQPTVATHTGEAEFMSLCEGAKEALWLNNLLKEFGIQVKETIIYEDNTTAISLAKHPYKHHQTKHIDVKLLFIRDHIISGNIKVEYIQTERQIADMLTKSLPKPQFEKLKDLCENGNHENRI